MISYINKRFNPIYSPTGARPSNSIFGGMRTVFYDFTGSFDPGDKIDGSVTSPGTFFNKTITIPIFSLLVGDVLWIRKTIKYSQNTLPWLRSKTLKIGGLTIGFDSASPTDYDHCEIQLRVLEKGSSGKISGLLFIDNDLVSGIGFNGVISGSSGIPIDLSSNLLIRTELYWELGTSSSAAAYLFGLEAAILRA